MLCRLVQLRYLLVGEGSDIESFVSESSEDTLPENRDACYTIQRQFVFVEMLSSVVTDALL